MKKKILIISIVVVIMWIAVGLIDYFRFSELEKPIFCISTATDEDTNHYVGLGYSFDIEEKVLWEGEEPVVTKGIYYLFGIEMESIIVKWDQ